MQTEIFIRDKILADRINQIISESNGSQFDEKPDDFEKMPTHVQPHSTRFEDCTNSNQVSINCPEYLQRFRSGVKRQPSHTMPENFSYDPSNNSVWPIPFKKESSCQRSVVSQEDIINVIDSLRAELIAARKKSEAFELEKKQRSRENENEILEQESSLNSLFQATRTKDRAYSAVPYATTETAHHYGDDCARQSNWVTEDIREALLEKPKSGNVKPTYVMENPEATEEQPLKIVAQHSDLPEKFRYRNDQQQDYLVELGEHLAEVDKKAADRTSAIVQKLQALEQALQKSERNEPQTQRERDPPQKARPDQSPRVDALQADRSRKQYEELYGAAVEALELGKHILKDVDEMAFNSLFTTGHRGVHALPSIIFCLYSAIRTLRSDLASKTAKYQQSAEVIKNIKEEILSDKSKMASDFDKRFKEEKSRMHSELAAAIQRAELATQEARTISERANKARESLQQELVEKNRTISELKRASADENTKLNANIVTLEAKIHALETSLEESRRETTRVKTERDEATKHYSSLTAKLEAREERIHTLENDLLDKKDRWRNTERKLQEATDALNRLYEVTTQATKTTTDINSLLEKFGHRTKKEPGVEEAASPKRPPSPLEVVKKLCTESSRLVTEHRHLIAQKNSLTSEMEKQAKLMKDSQSTINKLRSQIGAIERERAGITNTLELKQTQLQRISKERDYFLQLLNKKTEEVAALKATQAKTPEPLARVSSPGRYVKTSIEPKIVLSSEPQIAVRTRMHIQEEPKTDSLKVSLENESRNIGRTIEDTTKEIMNMQRRLCYEVPRPRPSALGGDATLEELLKRADGLGKSRECLKEATKSIEAAEGQLRNNCAQDVAENPRCLSATADSVTDRRLESLRTHLDTLKTQTAKLTNRYQKGRRSTTGRRSFKGHKEADLGKPTNPSPKKRDQPSLRSRAQKLLKSQQYNCSADRYFAQLGPESSRARRPAPEDEGSCCNCCYVCGSARIDKNRRTVEERKSTWTRSRIYGPYAQEATRESARQGHGDVQDNATGEAHCGQTDHTIATPGQAKENDTMLLANKLRLSMRKLQKSAENLLERVRSSSRDPPLPPALPSEKGVRDAAKSHHHHHHHREHRHHHQAAMGDPPRDPTATRRHHSLPVHSPREDLGVPAVPNTEQEGHYDSKSRQRPEEPIENQNNVLVGGSHGHLFSRQDPSHTVYEQQEGAWIRPQLDGHSDTSDEPNDVIGLKLDGSSASCPRQKFATQTAFAWDTESEEGAIPLETKKQSDLHCLENYDDANCE